MTKAKTIINNITKAMGIESGVSLLEIQRQWTSMFDTNIALHTYPLSLNNGILTIIVDSPIWLQEMRLHKKEVINKISKFYIKDIRVKLGTLKTHKASTKQDKKQEIDVKALKTPLWAQPALQEIKDAEIRDTLQTIISIISLVSEKKQSNL